MVVGIDEKVTAGGAVAKEVTPDEVVAAAEYLLDNASGWSSQAQVVASGGWRFTSGP